MNKAVQGAARLIFFAVLLLFTGCPDLFHDKEPEKPKEYTVTFDAAGGSPETQTRTVREGASLDSSGMPSEPGRDGYIFDGWYTDVEGEGSEFNAGTPVSEDITVYARWTAPPGSHTITFKLNNGTNTNWAARIVISGSTTGAGDFPGDPSRPGYTFAGWNTAAAGSGTPFTASTPVNANLTIYAQWTAASPGSYTVAFNLNDGTNTTWAAKTVSSGAATGTENFPANPSRPGYVFGGWNTQADGEGTIFSASTAVNADITVYAQWTEIPAGVQTVIFKLNDGTETIWAAESVTDPGTPVTAFPVPPARLSYIFAGWYTQANGGGSEFTESTAVSGNITVYAQWTGETYTVTFMSNYAPDMILYTKTVTVPATTILITDFPADPARMGYNFGSWNTQANGSGSGFTASTAVNASITVYAQWNTYSYTVTFNNNGGDTAAVPAAKIVASPAVNVDVLPVPPSRSSYIFAGWYTQADGGGSQFTESTAISGNITVYAQWTGETYTVTFKSNYGANETLYTKEVTVPVTAIADFPIAPSRTGYNFGGWNTQPGGGGSGFTASTAVTGNMTVYAQWNTYSYTVTFNNNGGDTAAVPAAKTVASPAVNIDALPAPPSRSSYIFAGWYTQADGGSEFTTMTTVNGNITVYARWTGETYTVTFKSNYDTNETLYTETVTVPATTIPIADFPVNPSRSSYIFAGWNTRDDGGGTPFTATTTVNSNITVYAKWIGETYTVTFKSNYGENEILYTKTVTVPATTIADFPADPSRIGYNFGSWNTQANGGGSGFTASTVVNASITVYAQWNTYSYTVTFNKNGGDTEADPAEKTVISPATNVVTLPEPPSRSSYIFTGWNTHDDGGGSEFTKSTTVTDNMTVYAQWTGETYTVTFKSNYGANNTLYTKTVTVPATAITGFPAAPSRLGYNFGSWNTQTEGGGSVFTESTVVDASITVYAQWDTYSYTVSFNKNGGDTEAVPTAKTVASPAINVGSLPVRPARSGYSFAGWNTHDDGGGSEFTSATTVSGNITVYAQWTRAIITLNPDAGDGTFSQGAFTLSKNSNESQTITITGSGYTNPRWLVDGDLKGTAASITINAADYGIGGHNLSLIINKSGVTWSKDITFTVTN